MGLFDIFKSKGTKIEKEENKILLSMPMFKNNERYNLDDVIEHLKTFWGLEISDINGNNETAAFNINGEMVTVAYMPVQIPWGDIKSTAQYAYNWMTAEEDLKDHNGHAIVSVMGNKKQPIERFGILSKLLCSILATSNCIGVYQGNESLLIPREQYLDHSEDLKGGGVPVLLWVYIGLRKTALGNSAYTYGLKNFKKQEIEIINSKLELEELHAFLANIASYIIKSDITFKSGETVGFTATQKIKITASKGKFVEGQTLKLEM